MGLAARILNVADVNHMSVATEVSASKGDSFNLDFQLVDAAQWTSQEGHRPTGFRYLPATGATMGVQFRNIDSALQFTRAATQPFPTDLSIWRVPILATDPLNGTIDLKLTLTEGSRVRSVTIHAGLLVDDGSNVC